MMKATITMRPDASVDVALDGDIGGFRQQRIACATSAKEAVKIARAVSAALLLAGYAVTGA